MNWISVWNLFLYCVTDVSNYDSQSTHNIKFEKELQTRYSDDQMTDIMTWMIFVWWFSTFAVFLAAGLQSLDCREHVHPEISRLNFFDTDLLRYAAEDKKGNVLVSPASIKSILAMILEVSSGNTESEIKSALRLSPYKDEVRDQLNLYLNALYVSISFKNILLYFIRIRNSDKSITIYKYFWSDETLFSSWSRTDSAFTTNMCLFYNSCTHDFVRVLDSI